MLRKAGLIALCVVMVSGTMAFAGGAGEGTAREQVVSLSTPVAPDHPNTIAANRFAEIVNNESGGRLRVEVYPANQLGDVIQVIENVMDGSVHMYIGGTSETSMYQPEFAVFDAPYLFRDYDHLMKASGSAVVDEMSDLLEANHGVKILSAQLYYGTRHLTTRNTPINEPADLAGMLIRAPDQPIYLEAVRAMGATPTPVAFSDLYMALRQGVVDGQENPIPTIYTYNYHEAQGYIMLTGHMRRVNVIGANAAWYNGLPSDLQDLIDRAWDEAVALNNELTLQEEVDMLDSLKELGMTVVEPNVEAFREAAEYIPSVFADEWGDFFQRLTEIE